MAKLQSPQFVSLRTKLEDCGSKIQQTEGHACLSWHLIYLFRLHWVFVTAHGASCGQQGLLSSSGAQASHSGGLPCCRAQTLGHAGSVAVVHGLSCPKVCGIFPDQGSNFVPSIDRWVLNHWITRKVLNWHPEALQNNFSKLTEVNKPLPED